MISGALSWLSVPIALFIAKIGAVSVFKAIYVDKRELKCACVGGSSNVPLGSISITENLMMIAVAVWMALAALGLAFSISQWIILLHVSEYGRGNNHSAESKRTPLR
jgi:hypothetical protein